MRWAVAPRRGDDGAFALKRRGAAAGRRRSAAAVPAPDDGGQPPEEVGRTLDDFSASGAKRLRRRRISNCALPLRMATAGDRAASKVSGM